MDTLPPKTRAWKFVFVIEAQVCENHFFPLCLIRDRIFCTFLMS